jgi:hypothetical protein
MCRITSFHQQHDTPFEILSSQHKEAAAAMEVAGQQALADSKTGKHMANNGTILHRLNYLGT